jgi:heat shock protein HslJ
MRRPVSALAPLLFGLTLASCAGPGVMTDRNLANTAWIAETIDGSPVRADARSTLRFFDRQLAGGSLGCNAYSTTYFTDNGLRFGAIAATRKACGPEVMQQEQRFSAVLDATRSVSRADNAIVLIDAEGKPRARLVPLKS